MLHELNGRDRGFEHKRPWTFEWRVSLGNVLTFLGGIAIAAVMLVTVTQAFDSVRSDVAVLSSQMSDIRQQMQDLRLEVAKTGGLGP